MPVRKITSALQDPQTAAMKVRAKYQPARLYDRYVEKCAHAGITEPLFVLSFDCDTEKDIDVAWDMHSRLMDMGIQSVYAVPGELLQKGEKTYSKIRDTGSEFINHGYRTHTYFDKDLKQDMSCFFYDQQTQCDLEEDIRKGHDNLKDVLGVTATGWRTPHFGTFEKPNNLKFLYGILHDLGYHFSTSSKPHYGFSHGPAFDDFGLMEIPVTGMPKNPLAILDSWAFFMAPNRIYNERDYLDETEKLISLMDGRPWLVNLYADPLHIYDRPEFFQAMEKLSRATKSIQYNDLQFLKGA